MNIMQDEESNPAMLSPRERTLWLICIHIVVGLVLGAIAAATGSGPGTLSASFIGLILSQTSLLGIWGGSGRNRWWIRLVGVLVGAGYLGTQFEICLNEPGRVFVLLVALSTLIVSAALLLARCFGFSTRLESDRETPATDAQFSIRHMMILTLVVAGLLALAKWQQPFLNFDEWPLAIPFAAVGFVAAWGVLGAKRPLAGIAVLLAVAVGAGYALARLEPGFGIWITATLTQALSLAFSLLVVRSCGYRLRRQAASRPGSDPRDIG
jgi:hypothetical protein